MKRIIIAVLLLIGLIGVPMIHDVDKNNDDRSSPAVNAHDTQDPTQRMAHGTSSVHPVTGATTNSTILRTKNAQVALNTGTKDVAIYGVQADGTVSMRFLDSNGVGIAQFGQFPDGSTALKVAKSGVEVSTATNSQLIFNSSQNVFKIVSSGTVNLVGPNGGGDATATATIIGGFTKLPIVQAYLTNSPSNIGGNGSSYEFNYSIQAGFAGIADWQWYEASISGGTCTITFHWTNFASSNLSIYTTIWQWYVLQESAAP